MGTGRRMCWVQLWLMAILAFFSQISDGSPVNVMSAPNLLRVGAEERIFVEIQNYMEKEDVDVNVFVKNHPTKTRTLTSTTVRLTKTKHFQGFGSVTIPAGEFMQNPNISQYVTLQAEFVLKGGIKETLEHVVLVSFQSGYIFIQTDKPIYTPSSNAIRNYLSWSDKARSSPLDFFCFPTSSLQGFCNGAWHGTCGKRQSTWSKYFNYRGHFVRSVSTSDITIKQVDVLRLEQNSVLSGETLLPNTDKLTPGGIIVQSNIISIKSGMYSEIYKLPEVVSFGQWKVVAKFHSNMQESFTAYFEVKEYVLPSFEVKISPPPETPFFYVDSHSLTFTIKATYMFGEEVDGTAYVVFGLIEGESKKNIPSSFQRVPIHKGKGEVTLKKDHITKTFSNIQEQLGKSIHVAVSVLTESDIVQVGTALNFYAQMSQTGSEMVNAELQGIKIVQSPYTIHFKKTPKYFKRGMSFDVMVEVLNPDGSPAKNILVVIEPGKEKGTTAANGMARLSINTGTDSSSPNLNITARTNHPLLPPHRQASTSMLVYPFTSPSSASLHMSVNTVEVGLGDIMKVDLYISNNESLKNDITYLVLSRGQLVNYRRFENRMSQQISLMVDITKEMLPSFRIVAYYHTTANELVSDSLWVDVKDTCMGTLKLKILGNTQFYEPRKMFRMMIKGDPGAKVGLVAVDKGVYALNNKNRLTQKKVWEVVEKYDTGCTAGGGRDSINVFYDAGLMFKTSYIRTPYRTGMKCPTANRRKRAVTVMDVRTTLVNDYKDKKLQKECCLDGMKDVPVSYTCERRSEYITDGSTCIEAFLHCCREMQKHKDERKLEVLQLARSGEDDGYLDTSNINSRFNFPESWFWIDINLKDCPPHDPNCTTTSFERSQPLPDSITTWQLTGVSLSGTKGLCVASPVEVIVFKPFFIDLRLPYSAVRGEQLEVKAILHNYSENIITVQVELKDSPGVCSAAFKKKRFVQVVKVRNQTTRAVPFIVIPMKDGDVPIEIKAIVTDSYLSDGIKKILRVVPQGVLVKSIKKLTLDPARKGIGGQQVQTINSDIFQKNLAPGTPQKTIISLTGIEQMSTLLDNTISGESMGTLIQEPTGCGEQNIAAMTLPVIAATYLDKTNQWQMVGLEQRDKALQHIKTGFQTQQKYHKPDGSFSIFEFEESSTWLTAYVAKVFSLAYGLVNLDSNVICWALKFLISQTQQPDGEFVEVGKIYDKNMIGDVGGVDSDASLTAFCLIAMQESRTICLDSLSILPSRISKAARFLEKRLPWLTNPYAVALTSYALANENKLNKEILYRFAASDRSHWPVQKGHIYTLEATAYALLALLKAQAFEEAKPVVRWLSQQQQEGGGYGSTQATIMVYRAVAEYCTNVEEPPYALNVDLSIQGRSQMIKEQFNRENHFSTRTSKFDGINKNVTVTATGTGEAILNMVSLYYALPATQESDCEMFDLKVELQPERAENVYKLSILVMYKNKERNASMSILDIGLPTGYTFNKEDLESLSSGRARIIRNYEVDNILSERSSLIIYLKKVSNERSEEISFRIQQEMKVGILQPAAVSVYEYYDKKDCVKFYRPQRQSGELLRLCQNNECVCAEESCSKQRKEDIRDVDRSDKACESTKTSKIDFVYKVKVEGFNDNLTTDIYNVTILNIYKEGNTDKSPQGARRKFLGYQHCRIALDLIPGKTYLIMGSSSDIYIDGNSFHYVLGENTWVEYWPTQSECQSEGFRPTCLGMEDLIEQLEVFGCQMK